MTPAEREARILSLESLVHMIAKSRMKSLPGFANLDEIISAGWLGAIKAVDKFDAERNVELKTFANWRIRGEIEDYLRSLDHLSRDHRRLVKHGGADCPGISFIDQPGKRDGKPVPIVDGASARDCERIEARLTVESIYKRARLLPRHTDILKRWLEGELMREIAATIGVKESRVSQICSATIRRLRAAA